MSTDTQEALEPIASRSWRFLPWFVLGVLALAVFELFAHPLLAASVFCLKFAVNDFRTAHWLWWRDPNRWRARACGLLFVAVGFWKAAVVNFGIFAAAIVYTLLSGEPAWPQRDPNAPAADFLEDPITPWAAPTVFAHVLEYFLGGVALTIAYSTHRKLWFSPRIAMSRKLDLWPPKDDRGVNWLGWFPALSAAAVPALIWAIGAVCLTLIAPPPRVNAKEWELMLPLLCCFGFMLTLPVPLLSACVQDKRNRYMLAQSPEECWGTT